MGCKELDILLPTYNRVEDLIKNIKILDEQINRLDTKKVRVLVSNNASKDNTFNALEKLKENTLSFELEIYHQDENIGLEPNAIFLLEKSTADFVMYLGDDDFLPNGYLDFVFEKFDEDDSIGCIIPGFSALYKSGVVKVSRSADFDVKRYEQGFWSLLKISHYGHQLSGLVTRREGLLEDYFSFENCRNIYPFIFFTSRSVKNYSSYYAPKFQVLVSQDNGKDWKYDDSGLLIEVFKNYKLLYPNETFKRLCLELMFSFRQSWRLRVGKNIKNAIGAFLHLIRSEDIDVSYKIVLPVLYPFCYMVKILSRVKRKAF